MLAEGLWDEWGPEGVDVLAVCPGATSTPGYLSARPTQTGWLAPPEMSAEAVVTEALAALGRQPVVIPGRANRFGAFILGRVLSKKRAIRMMGRIARRLAPPEQGRR